MEEFTDLGTSTLGWEKNGERRMKPGSMPVVQGTGASSWGWVMGCGEEGGRMMEEWR